MPVPQSVIDSTLRHATLLERLKRGQIEAVTPLLREMDELIRLRLSKGEITTWKRARLNRLLAGIDDALAGLVAGFEKELFKDLRKVALSEAKFQAAQIEDAITDPRFEAVIPSSQKVLAVATAAPLSVRGIQGGKLLEPFVKSWGQRARDVLVNRIRQGAYEGETNAAIVRSIRGDARLQFRNGILAQSRNQSNAMVRTAVQHISHQARMATFEANSRVVKRYQWRSTLDDRTSEICQGLSNEIFKVGEGPVPPAHVNCRSTIVPVLEGEFAAELRKGRKQASASGPVPADQNYFDWMKNQPAAFQDEALGPVKARLLRKGGLSGDEFRKLTRADNFRPLTLAEMEARAPLVFERAGIEITEAGRAVIRTGS